jgi:hypothetical protein
MVLPSLVERPMLSRTTCMQSRHRRMTDAYSLDAVEKEGLYSEGFFLLQREQDVTSTQNFKRLEACKDLPCLWRYGFEGRLMEYNGHEALQYLPTASRYLKPNLNPVKGGAVFTSKNISEPDVGCDEPFGMESHTMAAFKRSISYNL